MEAINAKSKMAKIRNFETEFIATNLENSIKTLEVKWDKPLRPKNFQTLRQYYPDIETSMITRKEFE